jgi:hypothetical protein
VVNPLEARTIGIRSVTAVTEYFVAATPPAEATSLTTRLAPQVRSALTPDAHARQSCLLHPDSDSGRHDA